LVVIIIFFFAVVFFLFLFVVFLVCLSPKKDIGTSHPIRTV